MVLDEASLKAAACHDYVCAEYQNSYRNGDNFIGSDCLPVDCDNDHSENPEDWITPEDVLQQFPGVTFAVHFSRFNMREKNGKAARPKFHVLFPIDYVTDPALYSDMKKLVNSIFPYFDTNALDAARFFFGTTAAEVALYPGRMNLTDFLEEDDFDTELPDGGFGQSAVIPEGSRNATMSRFAGRVIKKYGDTDEAYQAFLDEAAKCVPPLENSELNTIWHSAQRFFSRIREQAGYVPPEAYNDPNSYKPEDYSDVGQAEVMARYFSGELRYSPATHFIRYSDHYWQESEPGAQAVAHELTRRQMKEANRDLMDALVKMKNNGAQTILDGTSKAKAEQLMSDEQLQAFQEYLQAKAYQAFVIKRRDSKYITSALKETHPMLEISPRDLDADCFALNTPEATYDLRKGMAGAREPLPGGLHHKNHLRHTRPEGAENLAGLPRPHFPAQSGAHRLCPDDLRSGRHRQSLCGGPHHCLRRWPERKEHLLECGVPCAGAVQRQYLRRHPDRGLPQEYQAGDGRGQGQAPPHRCRDAGRCPSERFHGQAALLHG